MSLFEIFVNRKQKCIGFIKTKGVFSNNLKFEFLRK